MIINEAVQYIIKLSYRVKKIELELLGKFTRKPSHFKIWMFEVKQLYQVFGIYNDIYIIKLVIFCWEIDTLTWWYKLFTKSMEYELGHLL